MKAKVFNEKTQEWELLSAGSVTDDKGLNYDASKLKSMESSIQTNAKDIKGVRASIDNIDKVLPIIQVSAENVSLIDGGIVKIDIKDFELKDKIQLVIPLGVASEDGTKLDITKVLVKSDKGGEKTLNIKSSDFKDIKSGSLFAGTIVNLVYSEDKDCLFLLAGGGGSVEKQGTASPEQVLEGKTYNNGDGFQTGTMKHRGKLDKEISPKTGFKVKMESGYYDAGEITVDIGRDDQSLGLYPEDMGTIGFYNSGTASYNNYSGVASYRIRPVKGVSYNSSFKMLPKNTGNIEGSVRDRDGIGYYDGSGYIDKVRYRYPMGAEISRKRFANKIRTGNGFIGYCCYGEYVDSSKLSIVCDTSVKNGFRFTDFTISAPNYPSYQLWCFDNNDGYIYIVSAYESSKYQIDVVDLKNGKVKQSLKDRYSGSKSGSDTGIYLYQSLIEIFRLSNTNAPAVHKWKDGYCILGQFAERYRDGNDSSGDPNYSTSYFYAPIYHFNTKDHTVSSISLAYYSDHLSTRYSACYNPNKDIILTAHRGRTVALRNPSNNSIIEEVNFKSPVNYIAYDFIKDKYLIQFTSSNYYMYEVDPDNWNILRTYYGSSSSYANFTDFQTRGYPTSSSSSQFDYGILWKDEPVKEKVVTRL